MGSLSIDEAGGLRLPVDLRRRLGLSPGTELLVQETAEGLLLRRVDPPLSRVYVEPTNGCNLSCRTCVRNSWSEPIGSMAMEAFRRLVGGLRAIPTLRTVSFWGFGEPLLHPGIVEMVALARGLGARTELITNGLLLTSELSRGLVAAGLDRLIVSVDGASVETHADVRSGADLEAVQRNVAALGEVRDATPRRTPEIGLEFVAMRRNVAELPNLHRLAVSMGASFIVLTNVLPYTEELEGEILYGLSAGRSYPVCRSRWSPDILVPRIDPRREVLEPLARLMEHSHLPGVPSGQLEPAGGYCRFVNEGSVVVAWDGDVSPCIALMHSYRCYVMGRQKQIRRYTVGNVGREEIASIWSREEYARFRALVRRFDFSPCTDCGGCDFADSNEQDCFGNGFPACGDCLWAKGVIQCP